MSEFKKEKQYKIPKMIMAVAAVALLAAVGFTAAAHIASLSSSSHDAQEQVISLAAANRLRENQVAELTDSLEAINAGIMEAEKVMDRFNAYDEARKRAYLAACGRIDKCIDDFEKNVFSKYSLPEPAYYDSICELHLRLHDICASSYDRGLLPEYREDDAIVFRDELLNYYLTQLQKKYTEWQAALRNNQASLSNKSEVPENGED